MRFSVDWCRHGYPDAATASHYRFGTAPQPVPAHSWVPGGTAAGDARAYGRASPSRVVRPYAPVIAAYQRFFYTYGPLFGLLLLAGLAGLVRRWRHLGGPGLLPWLVAMALLVFPIAATDFDYQYVLPAVPLASLAGLALAAVAEPPRLRRAAAPPATSTAELSTTVLTQSHHQS